MPGSVSVRRMASKPKKGLWDNIHAKRKRIKAGSGERMRKPGEKGAPTAKALRESAKPKAKPKSKSKRKK